MKRIFELRAGGLICIGRRFRRRHDRFPVVAQPRSRGRQRLPATRASARSRPRVINVHGHSAYPGVIDELKKSGELGQRCRCRPSQYMNNVIEQDHRFVKKRVVASQWFRSLEGALNTIAGYEAMNIIRKGQIRWLAKGDIVGQARFIGRALGLPA